jgi:cytochrome c-type biogenesis protein
VTDLTLAIAVGAGLLSFLSPCVLPLVPAYLGQLTAVAVIGRTEGAASRWLAVRHAVAFVVGFGLVFTIFGLTATYLAGPLFDYLPALRTVGGALLIVLGLNLAGILQIPVLDRTWRPLESGAAGSLASATGTVALGVPGSGGEAESSLSARLGGRIVGTRGGWLASFGLGAVFAIGWTPCIGVILGGILSLAATSGSTLQAAFLLVAYTAGLGVPFVLIAAIYDRAPGILRPLVRHGQLVSLVGGLLVVLIGIAIMLNWLVFVPQFVPFNSQI